MHGIARNFFTLAIIYMAVRHGARPAHVDHPGPCADADPRAHRWWLGWLMSAVFAIFYHLVPPAARSRLATMHFWLTAV